MKLLNKTLTVILPALFVCQTVAAEAPPLRASYPARQVSDNTYVIHGPVGFPDAENQGFMNNPAFVLTDKGVVVIDPGSSVQTGRMVLQQIEKITDMPVVATFSTHIHGDHWLANQAITEKYPEAVLYGHPKLITLAADGEDNYWLNLMSSLTAGATDGTIAVAPNTPVDDGDVISIGGIDFSIYHKGTAHTTTDIAIMAEQENVLFTGDMTVNKQLVRMDDGSFSGLLTVLDYLIELEPKVVVPGHGETGDLSIMTANKTLYSRIYRIVEEKYMEGIADFEIKLIVMKELPEYSEWNRFEDSIGRIVSLCYLEVEENSF